VIAVPVTMSRDVAQVARLGLKQMLAGSKKADVRSVEDGSDGMARRGQ